MGKIFNQGEPKNYCLYCNNIAEKNKIECFDCDRKFILKMNKMIRSKRLYQLQMSGSVQYQKMKKHNK